MAKSPMGSFEIPAEMRNVAEHSVVQARQAFDGFMSAAQKGLSKMEQKTAAAQAGAKDAGEKIMGYAEQNVAASFEFAQRLVRAKDLDEMMRIQAEFVRSQMEVLGEQAKELGQGVVKTGRDAAQGKGDR